MLGATEDPSGGTSQLPSSGLSSLNSGLAPATEDAGARRTRIQEALARARAKQAARMNGGETVEVALAQRASVLREGAKVKALETFFSGGVVPTEIKRGYKGTVTQMRDEGDCIIQFEKIDISVWVFRDDFGKLQVLDDNSLRRGASGQSAGGSYHGNSPSPLDMSMDSKGLSESYNPSFALSNSAVGLEANLGNWRPTQAGMQELMSTPQSDENRPHPFGGRVSGAMNTVAPQFWSWAYDRIGPNKKVYWYLAFLAADLGRFLVSDHVKVSNVNPDSLSVVSNALSLVTALSISFGLEGRAVTRKIFNWHALWRFVGIAFLFTIASACTKRAYLLGTTAVSVNSVGQIYMPVAAILSLYILKRKYGSLEWFSLAIMSFSVMTFVYLRDLAVSTEPDAKQMKFESVALIVVSASTSALASILAERIYKSRSLGLTALGTFAESESFYIYKVHLDFASLLFSFVIWVSQFWQTMFPDDVVSYGWFGEWGWEELIVVAVTILQGWLAGLVTQYFSTVARSIGDTLVTVSLVELVDPLFGDTRFTSGVIPSSGLTMMILLSAMVFQTGRINIQRLRESMNVVNLESVIGEEGSQVPWYQALQGLTFGGILSQMITYSALVIFIASDASRTLSQQQALSRSNITPQSMVLACYLAGVAFATCLTISAGGTWRERLKNLSLAYSPRAILRYLPSSFFFAVSSTLTCLAFASGISASLATALGYVYMPISAFASRLILGKYYMWLEWIGLLILTVAAAVFGFLQTYFSNEQAGKTTDAASSPLGAMLMVVGSAAVSVLGSLVAEKLLKNEDLPFHIQKVRLDLGSVLTSLVILPIIGSVSTRPQDAFWKNRPLDPQCGDDTCWQTDPGTGYCFSSECTCWCDSGIWVAWSSWLVIIALVINVAQGWLTGVVIKQFSTVLRAIAQATTILVIYFIGAPLVGEGSVQNIALTLVAFTIPFSTAVFMVGASEMKKTVELAMTRRAVLAEGEDI